MIRFVNTFEPVVPLYNAIFPILKDRYWQPSALVSRGIYRRQNQTGEMHIRRDEVWAPSFLKKNKRWCAVFFFLLAPFHLLFGPRAINVFLTQPPFLFILGAWISRLTRARYVVHIMDMHPELLACSGMLSPKSRLYRVLSRLAEHALNHADLVVVIGRCMKQRLLQKGIAPSKIRVVLNWAPPNICPIAKEDNAFRQQHQLEKKFIILYSGNMGIPHQFDTLLKVAKKFEHMHDVLFLFIGYGAKRQEIEQAIAAGSKNLLLLLFQPSTMLPYSLSAADVHFLSLRPGFEGILVPSKFYGMLASGRPILYEGNRNGEVALVIQETGAGSIIEPGNIEQLYQNILFYYNNRDLADVDGQKGYAAYRKKYLGTISANMYVGLLAKALENPGN